MYTTSATNTLRSRFLRIIIIAVSAVGTLIATADTASAACGPNGQTLTGHTQVRVVSQVPVPSAMAGQSDQAESNQGIVGVWHVKYTDSQGAPFYESFDMWHSDGTEWETAYSDPRAGNYCLGVWKKAGLRTVQLNHIGWTFNSDGSAAGYFTLTETNTVKRSGDSYTGTFDYKLYDVNGNLVLEVTGTQVATRFKV